MTQRSAARQRAKIDAQAAIDATTRQLEHGEIDAETWHARVTQSLAVAYLIDDDPLWQSGFDGDAELWREAREMVLDAVSGDGTFLDIGCATGHLMECLETWARERDVRLTMFGLELSPDLARTGRTRVPAWADRIFEGNVVDWMPPMRFTYVRTGLEYVPAGQQSFLVRRLLRDVVASDGRLIVGPMGQQELDGALETFAHCGVGDPSIYEATDRKGKTRYIAWVEN